MDRWFETSIRFCWCAVLLAASAGCWQEVHYNPDKPAVLTTVVNDHAEKADETATDRSAPIAENGESEEITADELFGTPADATPPGGEPFGPDVAEVISQQSDEEDMESQETIDSTPDLAVESPLATESIEPSIAVEEPAAADSASDSESPLGATEVMRPSRTALAVWRMSSRWSFAAAIYAKGQPEERYRDSLAQATYAAELVEVELPAFPVSEGIDLETAVIEYLLASSPAAFVNRLGGEFAPEYEGLAELAIRTNALLLVYTPKSQQLDPLVLSIRQSAVDSGLPTELWVDLVSMLERREPFADVKHRVLSFHTEVGEYLAGEQ